MIARHFGSVASSTIKNFSIEKLPLVILVAKIKGNLEIFQVIHGNVTLDEFMSSLLSAGESYQSQLSLEKAEEMERDSRNQVKDEQGSGETVKIKGAGGGNEIAGTGYGSQEE